MNSCAPTSDKTFARFRVFHNDIYSLSDYPKTLPRETASFSAFQKGLLSFSLSEEDLLASRIFIRALGAPKYRANPNVDDIDYIARIVMRYPKQEALQALCLLHEAIRRKLSCQSMEALEWLKGGSSRTARGGFKDVYSLVDFLNTNPRNISPSRLITGLETLVTAIAYRVCKSPIGMPPYAPITREQKSIYNFFASVVEHKVPDHSKSYRESRRSFVTSCQLQNLPPEYDPQKHFISLGRQEISSASDTDEESSKGTFHSIFNKRIESKKTWVGAANEGNIQTRLGISGTSLISLSTIEWLFGKSPGKLDQETIELLVGVLILPTYIRGDYHSVAEVAAALQHFLASRQGGDPSTAVINPQPALKKGLELLKSAVDPKYEKAIEIVSLGILRKTKDIPYKNPPATLSFSSFRETFLKGDSLKWL